MRMSPLSEVTEDLRVMVTHLLLGQSPETHRTLVSPSVSPPFKRFFTTESGQEKSRIGMTKQLRDTMSPGWKSW